VLIGSHQKLGLDDRPTTSLLSHPTMAALLSKAPYDTSGMGQSRFRYGVQHRTENHGFFASPTESEFSEHYDSKPSVRSVEPLETWNVIFG
jgi:hypothetical protein